MIAALALLAASAVQAGAMPSDCGTARLAACRDTNELVWSDGFARALAAFLGDRRADLIDRGHGVADQAAEVLGGPPDAPTRIGPYWRFTACRPHSCDEKGAVVMLPDGGIVAVGILHGRCAAAQPGTDCFAHDTLTIYARHAGPDVIRNLKAWGEQQARGGRVAGLRATTLDAVEVVPV